MVDLLGPGAFGAARPAAVRPPGSPGNAPGDPDTWAQDCSSPTANDGTENRAGLFNMLLAQLRRVIRGSGVPQDNTDDEMLARAVRSQRLNYVPFVGGSANALSIGLAPAPPDNPAMTGVPLRLLIASTNTGPATLAINALPALPIRRLDGAPIERGDLPANAIVSLIGTGTAFVLLGVAYSEFRKRLTNTLTVYVRPDGNDNNDGSANTPAAAFATIQGALDKVRRLYDPVGWTVLVKLGEPGTYNGTVSVPNLGSPVVIEGDVAAQNSFTITAVGAAGSSMVAAVGGDVTVRGVRLLNNGAVAHTLGAVSGARIFVNNVSFAAAVPFSLLSHVSAALSGNILIGPGCAVMNDMSYAFLATDGGNITFLPGVAVSITNGITFYRATAGVSFGSISVSSGVSITGTITAVRYEASLNGVINTNGAGVNFFPGNSAGTQSSGGQYA